MKRDFTQENLQKLIQLFEELRAQENEHAADLAESIRKTFGVLVSMIGLGGLLKSIIEYNHSLSQMERYSRQRLEQIFRDISALDNRFGQDMVGFGLTLNGLKDLQEAMLALTEANNLGSNAVDEGHSLNGYFNPSAIREIMLVSKKKLDGRLEALENGADYNADNYALIPDSVKRERIKEMEKEHPEYKKQFADVLSDPDLTEQEKLDIKYIAYSAPEPYRSLYLEHLDEYDVKVEEQIKGSYYSPSKNEIHLKDRDETFADNPRGPYNTVFHESGHAIDDYEDNDFLIAINTKTDNYKYNGRTLNSLIKEDTRNYVNNIIESDEILSRLTDAQKKEILTNLNLTDNSNYHYEGKDASSKAMQRYQDRLQNLMYTDLYGPVNECASDVYGGVTNNAVIGSYGHRKDPKDSSYNYWYEPNPLGNITQIGKQYSTGNQESEMWAEFYAAKMTRDEEALESIRKHFPQAYEAMEQMAADMAKN